MIAHLAYERYSVSLLLVALNEDGKGTFKVLVVSADPEIKTLKDLKGHKIGLYKPKTMTHMVTKKLLDDEGLNESNAEFLIFQS